MKIFLIALLTIITLSTYGQDIIIRDINIIPMTSDTLIPNQSVWIREGKISGIGDYQQFIKNKKTIIINGKGKYLLPSLADMHVHLPEEKKVEKLLLSNLAAGVTHIRIMNSVVPQLVLREKLNKIANLISPKIHYSHLITNKDTLTEPQADALMQQLKVDQIGIVKLISLADKQTFENLTKTANKYNITICGHYPIYQKDGKSIMIDIEKVIKSNYKSIEHLAGYNSLQGDEQLSNAIKLTKEYDIYNCPTLDWDIMAYNLQYPNGYKERLTYKLLADKFAPIWKREYSSIIEKSGGTQKVISSRDKYQPMFDLKLKILKKLYDNNCLLLVGSDPGNVLQTDGFNVYEEMVNWSKAGIDNYTILKSSTVNPAKFLNESEHWGTIEIGKNAEFILLKNNPLDNIKNISTIETIIFGGKVYNNKLLKIQL